jgi:hypothetical protein
MTQNSTKRGATARLTDVLKVPLPQYQTKQDAYLNLKLNELQGQKLWNKMKKE